MKRIVLLLATLLALVAVVLVWIRREPDPAVAGRADRIGSIADRRERSGPSLLDNSTRSEVESAPTQPSDRSLASARTAIVVIVTDTANKPIADAVVEILYGPLLGPHPADTDGRCALLLEPGTTYIHLRVEAPGFVPLRADSFPQPEIRFALHRAVVVTGRVVDATTEAAIPNARLRPIVNSPLPDERGTTVDATGKFELRGIAEDAEETWAISADGYVTDRSIVHRPGPGRDIVVKLRRGVPLVLDVVDALSEAPIPDATIQFGDEQLVADGRGRIVSTGMLPEGDDRVAFDVTAAGYCMLRATVKSTDLVDGLPVRVPMVPGHRLAGTVLDEHGAVVRDARVRLDFDVQMTWATRAERDQRLREVVSLPAEWGIEGASSSDEVQVGSEGSFAFDALLPWSDAYTLIGTADGRDSVSVATGTLGGPNGTTTVDVVMPARGETGTVAGTITLNGEPQRASITWKGKTRDGSGSTAKPGQYRLVDVECGSVVVTTHLQGLDSFEPRCADAFLRSVSLEVQANQQTDLDLPFSFTTSPIAGRVTNLDGSAAAGVPVEASASEACWRRSVTTDDDGRFQLDVEATVPAFEVSAGAGPNSTSVDGVVPGRTDLELVLPGLAHVRIRVVASDTREPFHDAIVQLRGADGSKLLFDTKIRISAQPFRSDGDGWFTVAVAPGRYQLIAADAFGTTTGYQPVTGVKIDASADPIGASIEVEREPGLSLVLALTPGQPSWPKGEYAVALLEPNLWNEVQYGPKGWIVGEGAEGWRVTQRRIVKFDATGRAAFRGLPKGVFRFKIFPPTMTITPSEIVVPTVDGQPVVLNWTRH